MRLLRDIHGLLLLLLASVAFGQPSIEARVLDAVSNEPLPYASVVSMRSGEGVITNEEGVFRMTAVNDNDTLVFSYLGFRSL
ncbi:MAG: carboxypeptidase-like regulatory domain-containing protein, partial [Flavobacteriales bacterium]